MERLPDPSCIAGPLGRTLETSGLICIYRLQKRGIALQHIGQPVLMDFNSRLSPESDSSNAIQILSTRTVSSLAWFAEFGQRNGWVSGILFSNLLKI